MIRAVHIARFRGIRECVADGFGRVNLVIGRNDCGKTAFLEAVQLAEHVDNAALYLLARQRSRLSRLAKFQDFERFWQPMFFDLDGNTGLSIAAIRDDGAQQSLDVRRGVPDETIVERPGIESTRGAEPFDVEGNFRSFTWALDLHLATYERVHTQQRIVGSPKRINLPPAPMNGSTWIYASASMEGHDVRNVSALKQQGQDGVLLDLLREVDTRVSGIELLAPGGEVAELFVRLDNGTPMLPVALMGEGFQRCLELGAAAAAHDWPTLFIDEIENGMHHLVMEPLWRWIATTARRRNLQVFATTHSEECIQAASRAFANLDDDGLRVIRLDRVKGGTRATIYDRALVETAERTGTEIRG